MFNDCQCVTVVVLCCVVLNATCTECNGFECLFDLCLFVSRFHMFSGLNGPSRIDGVFNPAKVYEQKRKSSSELQSDARLIGRSECSVAERARSP